jgi:hypothetical protein
MTSQYCVLFLHLFLSYTLNYFITHHLNFINFSSTPPKYKVFLIKKIQIVSEI